MKMREIVLDFTSLLDVILIILFWFILNYRAQSQLQITQAEAMAEQAIAEAAAQCEAAEAQMLDAEMAFAAMADDNDVQAGNAAALMAFTRNEYLKISLVMEHPEGWHIEVTRGDEKLGSVTDRNSQSIGLKLTGIMEGAGYDPQAIITCLFTYNSDAEGSREAYREITEALRQIQIGNHHFYYAEDDVSPLIEDNDDKGE